VTALGEAAGQAPASSPAGPAVTSRAWVYSGPRTVPVPGACDFLPPAELTPLANPLTSLTAALTAPVGAPPLRRLASGARAVTIAIPDLTRACPNDLILPALLDELGTVGVHDDSVTVLVGCGLHRSTTDEEKWRLAGADAASRVLILDSQGLESPFANLGTTAQGLPVMVHPAAAHADLVIAVGVLEPHLYAGYSGGVKAVAIGCGGEASIAWTHRPAFISQAGVELCRLAGNPFRDALQDIAARTSLAFAVNAVVDDHGRVAALAAGHPSAVQENLAARFGPLWLRRVEEPYDIIVAGIKAPKHESLYQASRAATYLALGARPALRSGGLILLCADLPLGAGDGPGEQNFARLLADAPSPAHLIEQGLREPLGPGGQRAFVMARALRRFCVGVCGKASANTLEPLGIASYASVEEGLAAARTALGRAPRVLAVADALTTIPRG
jgi:nickel-dependent lactate racemase